MRALWSNTVAVTQGVKEELTRINRDFPDLAVVPIIDQSTFIERSNRNVRGAAISGAFLAILILFPS